MKSTENKFFIFITGICMGAADIVPGVSGGTIAFISGIYQRLLMALQAINPKILLCIKNDGIKTAWQKIDGTFLLILACGILISVFSLAHAVSYCLKFHAVITWSFFFALIFASSIHMLKQIKPYNLCNSLALIIGVVVAYLITIMMPFQLSANLLNLFIAGSIAICAMVLPGISGSFMLLMMGLYPTVIGYVKDLDILPLSIFATGCIVGLLCFSRLLSWLLRSFHNVTIALLTGLMIGSLNKVWPWKQETTNMLIDIEGKKIAETTNLLPWDYQVITGNNHQLVVATAIFVGVVFFISVLELCVKKSTADVTSN